MQMKRLEHIHVAVYAIYSWLKGLPAAEIPSHIDYTNAQDIFQWSIWFMKTRCFEMVAKKRWALTRKVWRNENCVSQLFPAVKWRWARSQETRFTTNINQSIKNIGGALDAKRILAVCRPWYPSPIEVFAFLQVNIVSILTGDKHLKQWKSGYMDQRRIRKMREKLNSWSTPPQYAIWTEISGGLGFIPARSALRLLAVWSSFVLCNISTSQNWEEGGWRVLEVDRMTEQYCCSMGFWATETRIACDMEVILCSHRNCLKLNDDVGTNKMQTVVQWCVGRRTLRKGAAKKCCQELCRSFRLT